MASVERCMRTLSQGEEVRKRAMRTAETAKIKDTILQGVYEENLKISDPCPQSVHSGRRPAFKIITRLVPVLMMIVLLALVQLIADPFERQVTDSTSAAEMVSIFPWTDILYSQKIRPFAGQQVYVPVPPYEGTVPETAFNAQRLLDYDFFLNHSRMRLSSVFGLAVQTIVIDPGHGGKDPGAIGSHGTKEKDIVLDIALRLRDQLMQSGRFKVLLTRDSDTFVSLADRVKFSNEKKADLFISLHINALPQKQFNVTETYYFGPPSDEYTLRIAEQENRGSEVLAGDFKDMIKKIGDVMKEQESAGLAGTLQHSLFSNMEKYDRVIADNGTKIAPFVVLLGVDAPSVLVEISCISTQVEEKNLNNPDYRQRITSALEKGIKNYLSQRHTQVMKGDDNGKKIFNKSS